ncbi:NF-kappa-B inhibitor-like protein 1 [Asterias amurensis]|uniref:NF-kappa-B inhibitor-like protein 1 n=1 Tax=Asterias amurensis TaxID=7602 RepID=UPI003AB5B487
MGKTKAERLFDYVSQGKVIKVKSFLKRHHRFDLNVVTSRLQRTLLHVACASGDDAVLRVLLKHGARVDVQDIEGDTPLHLALQRVLHGHRHAFEDLVIPILKSCPPNILDVANNRGHTCRQLLRDADQLQQESSEHLSQDSAEASEEELKRKEEAEWRARVQEEWETAGMWEENTTWDEQGYNGQSKESYDEWASRIASEHHQKQQQQFNPSRRTHRTKRDKERDQHKEEKRKFQEKLQAEHERYRQRRSERLHKKLLRQKEEYLQRCAEVFNGEDTVLDSIGYDNLPWPCRHDDPDKMMEVLMCDVDKNNETEMKRFMRSQQLLWHPDKFMQKCGSRLVEDDRGKILERVTKLSQALNRLSKEDKDR